MTPVRRADRSDREQIVATVVAAFADDPAWRFMHGDDYQVAAPLFAGALFDVRVERGCVWTIDGQSVAMWEEPGGPPAPNPGSAGVWEHFREQVGEQVWQRLQAYDAAVESAMESAMPEHPFWYLGVLATRPDRQGQGLAREVTAPVLWHADATGLEVCLETSTAVNVGVYERMGFAVAAEVVVPGGPVTWWMRREPRTAEAGGTESE